MTAWEISFVVAPRKIEPPSDPVRPASVSFFCWRASFMVGSHGSGFNDGEANPENRDQ